MKIRQPNDRRQATLKGVTGYDRRKSERRAPSTGDVAFTHTDVSEFKTISKEYGDAPISQRKGLL